MNEYPGNNDTRPASLVNPRPGECRVPLPERPSAMNWDEWQWSIGRRIEAGYPAAAVLRDNKDNIDIYQQVDEIRHEKLIAMLGGGNG